MTERPIADILMYHDVREPRATRFPLRYELRSFLGPRRLSAQFDDLNKGSRIVGLSDIGAALGFGAPLPEHAVALTFDDGLRDHLVAVMPLLAERRWQATFFVPVAPVRDRRLIPSHKIQFILAGTGTEADVVAEVFRVLAIKRREGEQLPSDAELWATYSVSRWKDSWWSIEMVFVTRVIREAFRPEFATQLVDHLFRRFVTADEQSFADDLYLSVSDVKDLARAGVTIGGHGVLSTSLDGRPAKDQEDEISGSARFLRDEIGVGGPMQFSYPNGSFDAATMRLLAREGFALAVTTRRGHVARVTNALDLPRFDGPQDFEEICAERSSSAPYRRERLRK